MKLETIESAGLLISAKAVHDPQEPKRRYPGARCRFCTSKTERERDELIVFALIDGNKDVEWLFQMRQAIEIPLANLPL